VGQVYYCGGGDWLDGCVKSFRAWGRRQVDKWMPQQKIIDGPKAALLGGTSFPT
jgi:hypothetical protein